MGYSVRAESRESSVLCVEVFNTDNASAFAAGVGGHNASRASEEPHFPLRRVYGTRNASSAHDRASIVDRAWNRPALCHFIFTPPRAMFEPCIPKKELQYSCDLCGELPITGRRWSCNVCEDFGASPALYTGGRPEACPLSLCPAR